VHLEARFGDRLRVEISVAPKAAGEEAPSLILQHLVEDALKHGLGPKPGPGCLSVSVCTEGSLLRLCVEYDGVRPRGWHESQGVGQCAGTAHDSLSGPGERRDGAKAVV